MYEAKSSSGKILGWSWTVFQIALSVFQPFIAPFWQTVIVFQDHPCKWCQGFILVSFSPWNFLPRNRHTPVQCANHYTIKNNVFVHLIINYANKQNMTKGVKYSNISAVLKNKNTFYVIKYLSIHFPIVFWLTSVTEMPYFCNNIILSLCT